MIILDTHAWIHWVNETPGEMSEAARFAIEAEGERGVCAISCWEVAMLVAKSRLTLNREVGDWIDLALSYPGVRFLPLDPGIAVLATRLPGMPRGDPADRMIAASCLRYGTRLVSRDERLRSWGGVDVVW